MEPFPVRQACYTSCLIMQRCADCPLFCSFFSSKLAAAILGGVKNIYMKPGSKVLYLGAASGTTVSHVSDLVGTEGMVYAVEFSHRSGRELIEVAKKRTNVVPIIED